MVAYYSGSNLIEIGDLGSKVKETVTQYLFLYSYFSVNFLTVLLSSLIYDQNEIWYAA